MRLQGRSVLLVGAGQTAGETIGNGRATALAFAREGADLLLVDIDPDSLEETRGLIRSEGFDAEVEVANVLVESDCRRLIDRSIECFGRLDILHYNVGRGFVGADASQESLDDWDSIMNVNLRGFFLVTKFALPPMREQRQGVILGISSAAAVTSGGALSYRASKLGMNGLVQSLAVTNGPHGIRVNAIMPGLLDTPMVIEHQAKQRGVERDTIRKERDAAVPLRRKMGSAWDIANAAVFLSSDEASYISGVVLPVDGAFTC
jgi:NAD(P)-dependent dehydrogenase (short-subunit alcohol dehydrogenase family)